MAGTLAVKLFEELKNLGIDVSQQQASNVKKLAPKNKSTATKIGLLAAERDTGGNFATVLDIFKKEAPFINSMNDAEQMAFLNNIMDYKEFGGKSIKTSEGIKLLDESKKLTDDAKNMQTDMEDLLALANKMKDDATKNKDKALKDLDDFIETGGQPFKKKDDKFLGGSMHEEGQLRTGIREFLKTEYKNGRIKLDETDKFRVMEYSPMLEDDPIKVFKKIYGDEAYNKAGTFPGAFEIGENYKHYEKIFRENMGEDLLKVKNKEYVGDGTLVLTDEVYKPIPDDDVPFAKGGRASFAGGKLVSEFIALIVKKEPIEAMKEVNKVIGKKGKYKNLTQKDIDKIVADTEDHIFQRDPDNLYVDDRDLTKSQLIEKEGKKYDLENIEGSADDINVYSNQYIKKLDQEIIDSGLYTKKEWADLSEDLKEARRKSFDSNYADAQEGMVSTADDMSLEESLTTMEGLGETQTAERFRLKQKYPGIDDKLLTNIINDTDPNNKARVLAILDEAMTLGNAGKSSEEIVEIIKRTPKQKMETGGRAGFYMGGQSGQSIIEPDLSDIGHGSDALMSRTRMLGPNSQATTSTGLNYLLGEDNDNTRVPFNDGLSAAKKYGNILVADETVTDRAGKELEKKLNSYLPNETEKEKKEREMFEMVKDFQKFKRNNPDLNMSFRMFSEQKKKEKQLFKNKIVELDLKYPEKEIIDKETGMVNTENLKEAIDNAEANLEISPIDGLKLKRSINTEGEQSVTSGSFSLDNLTFSSPNLEEGQLTTKGKYNFGDLDLSGMVNSNDGQILNTELGFNYDNMLKGKLNESDGYRSTELDLNKTFPISDKFSLNLTGDLDTQTFNGKTYKSSDLKPTLSYNDGIFNADISKSILEGGDKPNLGLGVNYNNFYAKGDNLLSEDRSGIVGYQKEFGNRDDDLFFTLGGEKELFDDNYTIGVGAKYKFADGGIANLRPGYSGGTLVDKGRRGFLKLLGVSAGGVAALKLGLAKILGKDSGAMSKKVIDEVIIDGGSGAPSWLQPLVNKALREGTDKTKSLAYKDAQEVKRLDTPTGQVDVYYDVRTGEVEIDYIGGNTALGESVNMRYTPGIADEGTKGGKPADEFEASEAIPEGRMSGPNDYNVEMGENTVGNVEGLYSDTSELAELAGQNPLIKDISTTIKKKKVLKKMNENPDEFASDNLPDYDY